MSWKPRNFVALLLIAGMSCWLQRHAAAEIEYLKAENRSLRAKLGGRRSASVNKMRRRPRLPWRKRSNKSLERSRSDCFAGYPAAMASRARSQEMDLSRTTSAGPPTHQDRYRTAHRANGQRQSELGLHSIKVPCAMWISKSGAARSAEFSKI